MRPMKLWMVVLLCAGTLLMASPGSAQTNANADSQHVIEEALKPSQLEANLRKLTDDIGGRVPGSAAMQKALAWGTAAFTAAGGENVHTEAFKIAASWSEGRTELAVHWQPSGDSRNQTGNIASFSPRVVSLAWAPALAPRRGVPIIDVGNGSADQFARAGSLNGAILLVHSEEMKTWEDLFAEYLNAPAIIVRAVEGKALAIAFQSTRPHDLLYRHTNSTWGEIDRLPMVLVAREDAGRMARLLADGQKLRADISIPNQIGGPVSSANVIAELKGSEKPNEVVILGAHLDSWELGTGALDNGCNAALVVDALRAIKASGVLPRRTIRFVLFSGEEEGLLGSRAYATSHRAELDRAAGVVIYDSGTGKTTGFSLGGRQDVLGTAKQLIAPLAQFDIKDLKLDMEWGTDHFDFMLEGVPTFVADQQEANYLENYHAVSDTYDKVDFTQLKKHVAEAAALSFELASMDPRIGPRLTHDQIEQTMR